MPMPWLICQLSARLLDFPEFHRIVELLKCAMQILFAEPACALSLLLDVRILGDFETLYTGGCFADLG